MGGEPWLAPIGLRGSVQGNHWMWPLPLWEIFVHEGVVLTRMKTTTIGSKTPARTRPEAENPDL